MPAVTPPPIDALTAAGVSIWLDDLSRERLDSGALARLVESRGVVGVTTNPTIFAGALAHGSAYDEQLRALATAGASVESAVETITTDDVRAAADVLRPVYEATETVDGRVSIEVDPRLARDTEATVAAARRLWATVGRPNVFVKIPATREGLPAITAALAEGISVNVTLIFSLERYREVMDAFLAGLELARAAGRDLGPIASVASFFVSRVDTAVDRLLAETGTNEATELLGRTAIANARLAFEAYEETCVTDRWRALVAAGARPQRPLWASTGVKNPAYPDTVYVAQLVTDGVVNTMPAATLEAFADHGVVAGDTVRGFGRAARLVLDAIAEIGIDLDAVTDELERDGVEKFDASWSELLSSVRAGLARNTP